MASKPKAGCRPCDGLLTEFSKTTFLWAIKEAAKRLYTAVLFKDCIAGKAKNAAYFSTTVCP